MSKKAVREESVDVLAETMNPYLFIRGLLAQESGELAEMVSDGERYGYDGDLPHRVAGHAQRVTLLRYLEREFRARGWAV